MSPLHLNPKGTGGESPTSSPCSPTSFLWTLTLLNWPKMGQASKYQSGLIVKHIHLYSGYEWEWTPAPFIYHMHKRKIRSHDAHCISFRPKCFMYLIYSCLNSFPAFKENEYFKGLSSSSPQCLQLCLFCPALKDLMAKCMRNAIMHESLSFPIQSCSSRALKCAFVPHSQWCLSVRL